MFLQLIETHKLGKKSSNKSDKTTQWAFICYNSTVKTVEKVVKVVNNKDIRTLSMTFCWFL